MWDVSRLRPHLRPEDKSGLLIRSPPPNAAGPSWLLTQAGVAGAVVLRRQHHQSGMRPDQSWAAQAASRRRCVTTHVRRRGPWPHRPNDLQFDNQWRAFEFQGWPVAPRGGLSVPERERTVHPRPAHRQGRYDRKQGSGGEFKEHTPTSNSTSALAISRVEPSSSMVNCACSTSTPSETDQM